MKLSRKRKKERNQKTKGKRERRSRKDKKDRLEEREKERLRKEEEAERKKKEEEVERLRMEQLEHKGFSSTKGEAESFGEAGELLKDRAVPCDEDQSLQKSQEETRKMTKVEVKEMEEATPKLEDAKTEEPKKIVIEIRIPDEQNQE